MQKLVSVAFLVLALAGASFAKVEVIVDAKNGDKISGERVFKVLVKSDNSINNVEFYLGGELKDTDGSTPYEFHVDTIALPEGPLKLKFSAYADTGESGSTSLEITVDNGLAQGLDFHIAKAQAALNDSKFDEAIASGRVALKIKPGDKNARMIMARAWFGKGVLDNAQKFGEDILLTDPENSQALDLLSAVGLQRAFKATATASGNTDQVLNIIRGALKRAVESRVKVLDQTLEKFGPITEANRLQYAEVAMRAGRYSLAIDQLLPVVRRDPKNTAYTNRLILAMMRAQRYKDLVLVMQNYSRYGEPDAAGYALKAIYLEITGANRELVDAAEREAVLNDGEDLAVRSAQAFIALRRGNTNVLKQIAISLAKDEGQRAETNYYLSTVSFFLGDSETARIRFERATLTEPALYDIYVEKANQALWRASQPGVETSVRDYQRKVARVYFETALVAKADSFEALTGLAIINMMENKSAEAVSMARAAAGAGPEYPAAQYLLNAAISLDLARIRNALNKNTIDVAAKDGQIKDARERGEVDKALEFSKQLLKLQEDGRALTKAQDIFLKEAAAALQASYKLDHVNLDGRGTPTAELAWRYFRQYGRTPLLIFKG